VGDKVSQQHIQQQNYNRVSMDTNILDNKLEFKRYWSDSQHLFPEFNFQVLI